MIHYRYFKKIFLAIFILIIGILPVCAQSFDYQSRPVLNFDFLQANIDLQLNPSEGTIKGSVAYTIEANINGADTLVLHASDIQIESVLSQQEEVQYSFKNDRLLIALADSSIMGNQYKLKVNYHAEPRFGLLIDSEGTIWTSMLPRSKRHWLPVFEHPRVEMITTLSLTVPADYTAAATGVKTDEEILGLDSKKVTFRSGIPVPVTALAFAAGRFNTESTSYGIKRIISYAEPITIGTNQQVSLTNKAKNFIADLKEVTGLNYPYQRIHIVVLNDHFWEEKPYGASTIFLYQNSGDLVNQLRRGLYAQWFGVYQHEEQWDKAGMIQFLQSVLHYKLADQPALLKKEDIPETNFSTVYENYSVDRWNYWQRYPEWSSTNMSLIANKIIPEILQKGTGTFTRRRYENIWYNFSGQPTLALPSFTPKSGSQSMTSDSIRYRVDYILTGGTGSLQLAFTAIVNPVSQPKTVPLKIIDGGQATLSEVTFSGVNDTLTVTVPAGVQNVRLVTKANDRLYFEEHKPISFLLYQLKNAASLQVRERAATQMGYHTDNPDLQLALTNYLNRKMEPEVEAALLRSYAAITDGATGTQQYFMEALSSNNPVIQKAALDALQNYPDDVQITQKLREILNNESQSALTRKALGLYIQRLDSTEVLGFTNSLIKQDTAGTKAVTAIAKLAALGRTDAAVTRAKFYIEPVYSYPVRKKALMILLEYDDSAQQWNDRMEMLLTDADPRIRFLVIQNMAGIPAINKNAALQQYMPKAYDARVYEAINDE